MAKDLADAIGTEVGRLTREAMKSVSQNARKGSKNVFSDGALSGGKGVAAGVGIAALAPFAAKGVGKLAKGAGHKLGSTAKSAAGDVTGAVADKASDAVPGPKDVLSNAMPGGKNGKGGKGKSQGVPGVGKGRRMPVQQDIDVGVPIKTVYNQWTQFEDWPKFMHRLESVSQDDETHVTFKTKIWGISKQFKAEIVEQRPEERIKWKVTEGVTHQGVVTFHELGPRLTRVELNLDVEPGSLIEKAGRGMRHVKRAVRADLARFKAYVLMEEEASGEWRGTIDDGDVKQTESKSRSSSRSSGARRSKSARSGTSRSGTSRSGSSNGRRSTKASSRSSSNGRSRTTRASSSSSSSRSSSSNGRSGSKRSSGRKTGTRS